LPRTMITEDADTVFINPAFDYPIVKNRGVFYTKKWPPLSLAYGAAILEKSGHRVLIIDAHAERLGPDEVAAKSRAARRVFISSSPLDRWQCPVNDIRNVYAVIRAVRSANPETRIYLTGPHGTTSPEKALRETDVDVVILSEPEVTVQDIARGTPDAELDGIAFRQDGRTVVRPKRRFTDLNELPLPAFHLLPMDLYEFDFLGKKFALLEGSRGCPYQCTFCYKDMYGPYRSKSSRKMTAELEFAVERFGVRNIYFADLTFTVDKNLVSELCEFIIDRGYRIRWACQTRLELVDEDILKTMRRAGCRLIEFGVESGTEEIVRQTRKYIAPKTISEGLRMVRKIRIESVVFMMLGLPNESLADMRKSSVFVRKLNPTYAVFNVALPYTEARNGTLAGSADEVGVYFPVQWGENSLQTLDRELRRSTMSFYLRPRSFFKVLRNPRSFFHKLKIFLQATKTMGKRPLQKQNDKTFGSSAN
jgi:anaerobic magnesium-protoporphyrin IX monomethyl ester cyclase